MTRIPNLEGLLSSENVNSSIIELDNFIVDLCDYGDNLGQLTKHQRSFYLNQNLEREVNNGGFLQYFYNSSGDNAHETISSLNEIGAFITSRILEVAISQFPGSQVPMDSEERAQIIAQIEDKANEVWSDLDQEFYKYQDDLNELNIEYVKKHKESF
jgi:hypothetical protein